MKLLFLIAFFCATPRSVGLPLDTAEYAAWEEKMLKAISDQSNVDPNEAIPRLGTWIVQLSPPSRHREREGRRVFHSAVAALIAIPGHANYYKMRIINSRMAFDEETGETSKGVLRSKMQDEQLKAFRTLALLPSPESVQVLGDFLEDERDCQLRNREGEAWAEGAWFGSNAEYALGALAKLPLISKPVPARSGAVVVFAEDIEAWRLWYGQVKLGKRTFQFEGDPRVYNLEGAVPEVAVSTRPRKAGLPERDAEASGAEEEMRVPWVAVGAALGLLGLAGFACVRSRRGNGGAAG